jgi:hypothetical protein
LLPLAARAQSPVTWPGCSDPVPAPAVAAGHNTEIFCDHFPAGLPEIDKTNVCGTTGCPANQYSWFALSGWPGGLAQGGANPYWCCTQINDASWFSNYSGGGGSGLSYNPLPPGLSLLNGGNSGGNFVSCATNGVANQWYGIAIPAASYVRWEIFSSLENSPGQAASLWQFPTEYMAAPAPGNQFAELDNSDAGIATIIYWLPGGNSSFANYTQGSYTITDFVISSLVVKAVDNGGTGFFRFYKADTTQLGSDVTWTRTDIAPGLVENHHMCLMVQAAINKPVNLKSVQVFSKYALTPGIPTPTDGGGRLLRRR